jgi:ferric-dicitrate binding protein FerR (iron transport regulator)
LLEGSIRVKNANVENIIHPGQQAQVTNSKMNVENNVDIEEVMGWKNGTFHFSSSDITEIMRQLSRWYNVEVVYNEKITDVFSAEIPRNTKLPDALKALEATGKLKFSIEDNKIVVMP